MFERIHHNIGAIFFIVGLIVSVAFFLGFNPGKITWEMATLTSIHLIVIGIGLDLLRLVNLRDKS